MMRRVHIRYSAVRGDGEYVGRVWVSQDITDIQRTRVEKRLIT
jgi:DUF438 domain-containing protein